MINPPTNIDTAETLSFAIIFLFFTFLNTKKKSSERNTIHAPVPPSKAPQAFHCSEILRYTAVLIKIKKGRITKLTAMNRNPDR